MRVYGVCGRGQFVFISSWYEVELGIIRVEKRTFAARQKERNDEKSKVQCRYWSAMKTAVNICKAIMGSVTNNGENVSAVIDISAVRSYYKIAVSPLSAECHLVICNN